MSWRKVTSEVATSLAQGSQFCLHRPRPSCTTYGTEPSRDHCFRTPILPTRTRYPPSWSAQICRASAQEIRGGPCSQQMRSHPQQHQNLAIRTSNVRRTLRHRDMRMLDAASGQLTLVVVTPIVIFRPALLLVPLLRVPFSPSRLISYCIRAKQCNTTQSLNTFLSAARYRACFYRWSANHDRVVIS